MSKPLQLAVTLVLILLAAIVALALVLSGPVVGALWITNMAILLGAELNSETERTRQIHMGVRGAESALKVQQRAAR